MEVRSMTRELADLRDKELFALIAKKATAAQKDEIGRLWLLYILGEPQEVVDAFLRGEFWAQERVGHKHAGINPRESDPNPFWTQVGALFPEDFTLQVIRYLSENNGAEYALTLVAQLNSVDFLAAEGIRDQAYKERLEESMRRGAPTDLRSLMEELDRTEPSGVSGVIRRIGVNMHAYK
jgi:hypothetical protein